MTRLGKRTADVIFILQVLIVFVLLFEERIVLPAAVQAVGRMHPMLLHLPIGLVFVTALLLFLEHHFGDPTYYRMMSWLMLLTALTASLTTLLGLLLSFENTFSVAELTIHKWSGVALSFGCWLLVALRRLRRGVKPIALATLLILIVTGHYGARLTHGENFVLAPLIKEAPKRALTITDSTTLFEASVQTILDAKCISCHNPNKAKGRLMLSSLEGVKKGGKSGPLIIPSDTEKSLLIQRLLLPIDHDDHMPPADRAQLLPDELALIKLWVERGADTNVKLSALPDSDTLSQLSALIIPRYQAVEPGPQYRFRYAAMEQVSKLNRPNRTVFQIASNEPALDVEFYLRGHFDLSDLDELMDVKTQVVSLSLATMPVTDEALKTVAKFENLERLNLNRTDLTGEGLHHLGDLKRLRSISLTGTKVTREYVDVLGMIPSLRKVFLWNTEISPEEAEVLSTAHPHIHWNTGFVPDMNERLKLNAPSSRNKGQVLADDESIVLHHSLPGTAIHYTLDGSEPDSLSPAFDQPVVTGPYTEVKAKAYRDGWVSSDVAEFFFFRKGLQPDTVVLHTSPDAKYPGEGATTLVDNRKGVIEFYRHPSWMAFREESLILDFHFGSKVPKVQGITLSFAHSPRSYCFPPATMELWGGHSEQELILLGKSVPNKSRPAKGRTEGVNLNVAPSSYPLYRLVATPVQHVPEINPDRQLWLMVDEVYVH